MYHKSQFFFKGQGAPWEVKWHKGVPWWQLEGPFQQCLAEALPLPLMLAAHDNMCK
jgi:hypothetical protein